MKLFVQTKRLLIRIFPLKLRNAFPRYIWNLKKWIGILRDTIDAFVTKTPHVRLIEFRIRLSQFPSLRYESSTHAFHGSKDAIMFLEALQLAENGCNFFVEGCNPAIKSIFEAPEEIFDALEATFWEMKNSDLWKESPRHLPLLYHIVYLSLEPKNPHKAVENDEEDSGFFSS